MYVDKATEGLENELWRRWSEGNVGEWPLLILQNLPSLYLRHSSFSNPSVASATSQLILQPYFASPTSQALHLASCPWQEVCDSSSSVTSCIVMKNDGVLYIQDLSFSLEFMRLRSLHQSERTIARELVQHKRWTYGRFLERKICNPLVYVADRLEKLRGSGQLSKIPQLVAKIACSVYFARFMKRKIWNS